MRITWHYGLRALGARIRVEPNAHNLQYENALSNVAVHNFKSTPSLILAPMFNRIGK